LVELHAELLHADRGDVDHRFVRIPMAGPVGWVGLVSAGRA
jgi:hypothetical protein